MIIPDGAQARAAREQLARDLRASGALTPSWEPAFWIAPRHVFLPEVMWVEDDAGQHTRVDRRADPRLWWQVAYQDVPIITQFDDGSAPASEAAAATRPSSSNSMPTMVFQMLQHLAVNDGHRVLEIGTGTGWNAALLAARLGDDAVVSVELDPKVAAAAKAALAEAGRAVTTVIADGAAGWPERAAYDRIISTASVTCIPPAWIEQCRPGGVILTPWVPLYGGEGLVQLTAAGDGTAFGPFVGSSAFMPLRAHRFRRIPHERYLRDGWPGNADKSMTDLPPTCVVEDWITEFAIGLQLRDVYWIREPYDDGTHTLWLYDSAVSSWASADWEPDRTAYEVYQSGPRRLWDDVERAWRWWQDQGSPRFERFGLTVTPHGEHAWLDEPTQLVPMLTGS